MLKRIIMVFIILLSFIPIHVSAINCSYEKLSRLKQIASNINYDYVFHENGANSTFEIRFINIEKDVYLYDVSNNKTYTNFEINVAGMKPGNKYHFIVKSKDKPLNTVGYKIIENNQVVYKEYTSKNDNECSDELRDINVVLPSYNHFYKNNLCKGIENEPLCYKWNDHNLSEKDWVAAVNELKKKEVEKENSKKIDNINFFNSITILTFLTGIIIFLIILIKYLLNKKRKSFNGW